MEKVEPAEEPKAGHREKVSEQAGEIVRLVSLFASSALEEAKARLKAGAMSVAVASAFVLLCCVALLVAAVFLMYAAAEGLSHAFELQAWQGYAITGAALIVPASILLLSIHAMAKRKASKKARLQRETSEKLTRKITDFSDLRWWIREYPFYSTGAAAAAGFTMSGVLASPASPPRGESAAGPSNRASPLSAIFSVAENALQTALVSFAKDFLSGLSTGDGKETRQPEEKPASPPAGD